MNKNSKIYVAGHNGMVGSSILRLLISEGYTNIITKSKSELNLVNKLDVESFFKIEQPEFVFLAAAKVGGINANMKNPAGFLFENIEIQNNVIHQSYISGVKKLCFLGSSCIYPRQSEQPIKEEYLLSGDLEPTNEGYALAKIVGLKMLKYYSDQYGFNSVSPMPCNLYGPNDSFDLEKSHVLSALIRRFVDAKDKNDSEIVIWGTGIARREFMHVDDVASACLFLMENYNNPEHINIGWGKDISIKELVDLVKEKVGFDGVVKWDSSKPDGMLRKCLDVTNINSLGFTPKITLNKGIDEMISIYKKIK